MARSYLSFDPREHAERLVPLIEDLRVAGPLDSRAYQRLINRHPRPDGGPYSKREILGAVRAFADERGWNDRRELVARLRTKPVRTISGVAPVTVLTKPFPCPGRCVFCPSDVRQPKSYLSREPGAQRAAQHRFDPYRQTLARLLALDGNGHPVDKVELLVLGGTWSSYPLPYQIWFVTRCFDAMNDFAALRTAALEAARTALDPRGREGLAELDFAAMPEIDGAVVEPDTAGYNHVVGEFLRRTHDGALLADDETATWERLEETQRANESAAARCVGLVLETRPDHVDPAEVLRLRRLGATKVQLGVQSLDDAVLRANRRGHDVAASRRAVSWLRRAGFKLHLHWMPNLHGSSPERDVEDFARLFDDPALRPDELKIYPCSLIESAELMQVYRAGQWRPYTHDELLGVLVDCLPQVPAWCRVTRVIRDIPGDDILVGNQQTNFREVVERRLDELGRRSRDIRAREVRARSVAPESLRLEVLFYESSIGRELFLQMVDAEQRLAGFARLTLPTPVPARGDETLPAGLDEIRGSALLREVHVYGGVVALGGRRDGAAQHAGLGRRLVAAAAEHAFAAGAPDLAVISAVGTRAYYRRLGFVDGSLYQHLALGNLAAARRAILGREAITVDSIPRTV
ncbi:MAG: tRNA uridine(34) 5-carboxymethylaminomethyl modification radical SAM/GNAT enzyme Elp3 [Acidobacteriota bacterium]